MRDFFHHVQVIVDEAHGLGIFGKSNPFDLEINEKKKNLEDSSSRCSQESVQFGGTGVIAALNLENHSSLLASVYTFGKAAGCHGAVICASKIVTEYLVNYARPFVYSTALPPHSIATINSSYDTMISQEGEQLRDHLFFLVRFFQSKFINALKHIGVDSFHNILLPSPSPIQAILCPGNEECIHMAKVLRDEYNFDVYPIRSPTVPNGSERIRIIIHSHNTSNDVLRLVDALIIFLKTSGSTSIAISKQVSRSKL
jgi:8-amino-7-oxononanoate synthase